MTIDRIRSPKASLLLLVALTTTITACPGTDPGTDGTTTEASSTSTGPEPTTTPITTGLDDTTTTGVDGTSTTAMTGSTSSTGADGSSSSSETAGATDTGSTTTTGDTESSTTGDGEPCQLMLPPPGACGGPGSDPIGLEFECNPITQDDCAAGQKCMPWSNDGGGSWNATTCAPLDPAPVAVGGVCTVEGSGVSGLDDCELGAMCWDVDPMTNQGTCIELCGCSYDDPICDTPNAACAIVNGGVLPLCIPACNPLDPAACPAGQGCYPVGELFQCAPDASGGGGGVGDPCEFINVCQPGNVCLGSDVLPGGCGASGCCLPTCDIDDPAPPCPPGTDCMPWYEAGAEPDACLGSVGACAAP